VKYRFKKNWIFYWIKWSWSNISKGR